MKPRQKLTPDEVFRNCERSGWKEECQQGEHRMFTKGKSRIAVHIKTGEITSLNDPTVERFQNHSPKDGYYLPHPTPPLGYREYD